MDVVNRLVSKAVSIHGPIIAHVSRHWSSTAVCIPFTREGDNGVSTINSGVEVPKDDRIFNAIGATDELSSYIGLAREFAKEGDGGHTYTDKLKRIQCILMDISSSILKSYKKSEKYVLLSTQHTQDLEEWILEYSQQLPPFEKYVIPMASLVENFKGLGQPPRCVRLSDLEIDMSYRVLKCEKKEILLVWESRFTYNYLNNQTFKGGGKASTSLHIARTVCRRAERCVVPLVRDGEVDKEAQVYLNRLADFLLTISRYACKIDKKNESIYIPSTEQEKTTTEGKT